MAREAWKNLLEPWGIQYGQLIVSLDAHCENLSDEDLLALEDATKRPTQTNCGWADYGVAPFVREAVTREHYRRLRAAEATR